MLRGHLRVRKLFNIKRCSSSLAMLRLLDQMVLLLMLLLWWCLLLLLLRDWSQIVRAVL